ncbi:putative lipid II flippase FtsW [Microaceticoccus formicicus]|uniref:putative lipid II flippase FtsW n=1 Tax=Microaceticoccus formicicus TaxID=3118105 RepID=UPI003CD0108C|nr:putative lipid II flippase FtsW [Peptoniphilaceae bacterium AMB_02]
MQKTKLDIKLLTIVIILLAIGVVMVYSSSWPYAIDIGQKPYYFAQRQLFYALLGFVIMIGASFIDYKIYRKLVLILYPGALLLCLLLFTPLGKSYDTFARRWLAVGPISFMPSDFMKVASIMLMALFLTLKKNSKNDFKTGFLVVIAIIGLSVLPVYLQPNLSTTITITLALGAMYLLSGMNLRYFLVIIPVAIAGGFMLFVGEKNAYRIERIKIFLNPLNDYLDKGWQLSQALFAVSSGGFFGLGLGKSRQKYLYLSESHNDFIFAIIAEELGFLGSLFIIFMFLMFIKRGLEISVECGDEFGRLLAAGITMIIGLQALINMGVSFGLIPPTGLVLPFVSYGGTSLVVTMGMVGILLNISKFKTKRR